MARQISKSEKEKIDEMSKAKLGRYIMRVNPRTARFRYAIRKFTKK